jgi:hypothetical protein
MSVMSSRVLLDIAELSEDFLVSLPSGFALNGQQLDVEHYSLQIDAQTESRIVVLDLVSSSLETIQSFLENLVDDDRRNLPVQVVVAPGLQASSTATLSDFIASIPYANKRLFVVLGTIAAVKKKAFLVDVGSKEMLSVGFEEMLDPVDLITHGFGSLDSFRDRLDRPEDRRDRIDPFYDADSLSSTNPLVRFILSPLSPSFLPPLYLPSLSLLFSRLPPSSLPSSLFSKYIVLHIFSSTDECFWTPISAFPDPDISAAGAVPVHPCPLLSSPPLSLCFCLCPSRSSQAFICLSFCLSLCFCLFFV